MGAFIVIIAAILLALWAVLLPLDGESPMANTPTIRPSVQAVAGNMVQFHQAAVDFVSQTANRTPVDSQWAWGLNNLGTVLCTGSYPTNSAGGTCVAPTTEFRLPSFISTTSPLYNWNSYYVDGSTDMVVTYSRSGDEPGGFTPTEINAALVEYGLANNYNADWYWGVTGASAPYELSNGTVTLTVLDTPVAIAVPLTAGVIAIATVIP